MLAPLSSAARPETSKMASANVRKVSKTYGRNRGKKRQPMDSLSSFPSVLTSTEEGETEPTPRRRKMPTDGPVQMMLSSPVPPSRKKAKAESKLGNKSSKPAGKKTEQLFIDIGQRLFESVKCKKCGMIYAPGEKADEAQVHEIVLTRHDFYNMQSPAFSILSNEFSSYSNANLENPKFDCIH